MSPPTSRPLTRLTTSMLLLLSLPLTTSALFSNNNDKGQKALAPLPSTLSHLSALFSYATPSSHAQPQPPCCGPSCPPQACNIHLSPLSTNLAYLFPLPTAPAPPASKVTFPCCGGDCPDGGCRAAASTGGGSSERPSPTTAPPRATEAPPEGGRLIPGFMPGGGDGDDGGEASIIIGCCSKCRGCIQSAVPGTEGDTATELMFARATATEEGDSIVRPTPPSHGGDGDDGTDGPGVRPGPGAGGPEQPPPDARPPRFPGIPNEPQICVGCVGGICFPCIGNARAPPVAFMPAGVGGGDGDGTAQRAASFAASAAASVVAGGGGADEPQPTILMAADVADAVKGLNQDVVPVVVQSFGPNQDGSARGKGEWELLTLLASVDLKVQDNYLSRRVVEALGLGGEVKGLKKGTGKTAVLSAGGKAVSVSGYVDAGIVIGSRSGIVIGSVTGGEGEWYLLRGVRWFVHGEEGEDVLENPDVVLGTKVLAEVGGLSVVQGVRREVQAGVKVLGIAHFVDAADAAAPKQGSKDEL